MTHDQKVLQAIGRGARSRIDAQMGDGASTGEFEPGLDGLLQRFLDRRVPGKFGRKVAIDLEGFVEPPEVAVVVGIKERFGLVKELRLMQIEPQTARERIELGGKGLDMGLLEELGGNALDGLAAATFGKRQDALGVAVEGNGSVGSERVGDGDELAAQPRRVGARLRQVPWRRVEGLGVAFVVDGGQERLEGELCSKLVYGVIEKGGVLC